MSKQLEVPQPVPEQDEEMQRQKRVQAFKRFIGEQCRRMVEFEEVEKRE